MANDSIYHSVTEITEDYLGPAANRFVDRIIESHFHKMPEKLTAQDIPKFVTWIKFAVSMLTDDPQTVEEYTARLKDLSAHGQPTTK